MGYRHSCISIAQFSEITCVNNYNAGCELYVCFMDLEPKSGYV